MAGNRAPSVICYFHHSGPGDILVQSVNVPKQLCTKYTYYCCLNWNMGKLGGGYCGIQCHEDGNCFICSLWDPPASCKEPIKAVFQMEGKSFTERFGGEGTGLKYINLEHQWEPDTWYTFVMRRWHRNETTHFGLWVQDVSANRWTHMVTMAYPIPNVYFESPIACFVEDWHGNGNLSRGANFKETFRRSTCAEWECMKTCQYYVNKEDACKNWNDNFCVKRNDPDSSFLSQTGGNTKPSKLESKGKFVLTDTFGCEPSTSPIQFKITKATIGQIQWNIEESSTPQFSYRLFLDGIEKSSDINSECRSVDIDCSDNCKTIELCLQGILGQETIQRTTFS